MPALPLLRRTCPYCQGFAWTGQSPCTACRQGVWPDYDAWTDALVAGWHFGDGPTRTSRSERHKLARAISHALRQVEAFFRRKP